mmetsp:Transcript_51071/g.128155  ORF Transcript_51071/g.128155 Transcript_51071/m.128155 type:complete len:273 (+) Transcript_51071:398-1216(+)
MFLNNLLHVAHENISQAMQRLGEGTRRLKGVVQSQRGANRSRNTGGAKPTRRAVLAHQQKVTKVVEERLAVIAGARLAHASKDRREAERVALREHSIQVGLVVEHRREQEGQRGDSLGGQRRAVEAQADRTVNQCTLRWVVLIQKVGRQDREARLTFRKACRGTPSVLITGLAHAPVLALDAAHRVLRAQAHSHRSRPSACRPTQQVRQHALPPRVQTHHRALQANPPQLVLPLLAAEQLHQAVAKVAGRGTLEQATVPGHLTVAHEINAQR